MKLEFSRQILEKILKYQISWISVQWDSSCFMRTDRRTDMTKLIVALRNFAKVPKNCQMFGTSRIRDMHCRKLGVNRYFSILYCNSENVVNKHWNTYTTTPVYDLHFVPGWTPVEEEAEWKASLCVTANACNAARTRMLAVSGNPWRKRMPWGWRRRTILWNRWLVPFHSVHCFLDNKTIFINN